MMNGSGSDQITDLYRGQVALLCLRDARGAASSSSSSVGSRADYVIQLWNTAREKHSTRTVGVLCLIYTIHDQAGHDRHRIKHQLPGARGHGVFDVIRLTSRSGLPFTTCAVCEWCPTPWYAHSLASQPEASIVESSLRLGSWLHTSTLRGQGGWSRLQSRPRACSAPGLVLACDVVRATLHLALPFSGPSFPAWRGL
ncbi:hypothetical protein BD289DRAFT_266059 [Coniella lustricola]|uniref:Uncharacterized protein n=1 Tax=Coniella lustricola TaxID=2025994 RepID=A0A2T3A7B5_9PEZI|nr:hypothetical protein BD289DRAFT_266059 [Coniella lustricola]